MGDNVTGVYFGVTKEDDPESYDAILAEREEVYPHASFFEWATTGQDHGGVVWGEGYVGVKVCDLSGTYGWNTLMRITNTPEARTAEEAWVRLRLRFMEKFPKEPPLATGHLFLSANEYV